MFSGIYLLNISVHFLKNQPILRQVYFLSGWELTESFGEVKDIIPEKNGLDLSRLLVVIRYLRISLCF